MISKHNWKGVWTGRNAINVDIYVKWKLTKTLNRIWNQESLLWDVLLSVG